MISEDMLAAFQTRLIGHISSTELAAYLASDLNSGAETLQSGQEFCVPFGEERIQFWVCDAD
jgi:hypothetical protein